MTLSSGLVHSALLSRGRSVTLRRIGDSPPTDVACLAKIDGANTQIAPGGVSQSDRRVIISNEEIATAAWPGPPRRGDQIIADGKTMTVANVDTKKNNVGGGVVMHILQVRGS